MAWGLLVAPVRHAPACNLGCSSLATACTVDPPSTEVVTQDPNAGLLRDFLDGKFDSAGHPVNARVSEAESLCPTAGVPHNGSIRLSNGKTCEGTLSGSEQYGDLVASLRLSIKAHPASGTIVSAAIVRTDGEIIANTTLDDLAAARCHVGRPADELELDGPRR